MTHKLCVTPPPDIKPGEYTLEAQVANNGTQWFLDSKPIVYSKVSQRAIQCELGLLIFIFCHLIFLTIRGPRK